MGSASPAARGPGGLTKRATLIGCRQPRGWQLRPRTANRRIDMQISCYKRGGAAGAGRLWKSY